MSQSADISQYMPSGLHRERLLLVDEKEMILLIGLHLLALVIAVESTFLQSVV